METIGIFGAKRALKQTPAQSTKGGATKRGAGERAVRAR